MILNYLRLGMTCKRKHKWIGKVNASTIEDKKNGKKSKDKSRIIFLEGEYQWKNTRMKTEMPA